MLHTEIWSDHHQSVWSHMKKQNKRRQTKSSLKRTLNINEAKAMILQHIFSMAIAPILFAMALLWPWIICVAKSLLLLCFIYILQFFILVCKSTYFFSVLFFFFAVLYFCFSKSTFIFLNTFIYLCKSIRPWIDSLSLTEWCVISVCVTAQSITWMNRRDSSWTSWIRWGSEWSAWQESVRHWSGVFIKRRVTCCDSVALVSQVNMVNEVRKGILVSAVELVIKQMKWREMKLQTI